MAIALELSRTAVAGNLPCGALLVRDDRIVSQGMNTVNSTKDPTAHAEVMAIRNAAHTLGTIDLAGTTLYATMEPCPMCLWSILLARIERLVLGARHDRNLRPDLGAYTVETFLRLTGRPLDLITGVLERECEAPFRAWAATHPLQGMGARKQA